MTTGVEAMRSLAECDSWDEYAQSAEPVHEGEPRPGLLVDSRERRGDLANGPEQLRAPAGVRAQSRGSHSPAAA